MDRITSYLPFVAAIGGSLVVGHLGLTLLPPELAGFSTPILLCLAVGGSIVASLRWL